MTYPTPAIARSYVLGKMRMVVGGYVRDAVDTYNAATGVGVPYPQDVRIGATGGQVALDVSPLVLVVEMGADSIGESIAGRSDFQAVYEVQVQMTTDPGSPERTNDLANALLSIVLQTLETRLPDYCTMEDGVIVRADILAAPASEIEPLGDSSWVVASYGTLGVLYRATRNYLPTFAGTGIQSASINAIPGMTDATLAADGSGAADVDLTPLAETVVTLTSGQLAATTGLTVTFPTGALADGSPVSAYLQSPMTAHTVTAAGDAATIPVASIPLADGAEILIVGVAAGTLIPWTYRVRIEVA